jgi:hypothetical protein
MTPSEPARPDRPKLALLPGLRGMLDLEHMGEPLAPPEVFRRRMLSSASVTAQLLTLSLAIGVAGYHWIVGIPSWVDSLLSASMIMGGMGPIGAPPTTVAGKLFASFYALYSGVMLLACVGVLLAPGLHRVMHTLHVPTDEGD